MQCSVVFALFFSFGKRQGHFSLERMFTINTLISK
jgi:hypothetical protein